MRFLLPGEWPFSEPPEALGILPAPLHPPLEVTAALGPGQAAPQECSEYHTCLPKVTVMCSLSSLSSGCSEVPLPWRREPLGVFIEGGDGDGERDEEHWELPPGG